MFGKLGPLSIRRDVDSAECDGGVRAYDRWLARKLFEALGISSLRLELWDYQPVLEGERNGFIVRIKSRGTLYRMLWNPSLGFGDGFTDGSIEVEGDLPVFLNHVYLAMQNAPDHLIFRRSVHRRRNTLNGSKRHIHSHYDLGNEFYRVWLDREMVYTCAYYPTPDTTLDEAQIAKMDHVCRKLRLRPGQQVIETGCGWGSLALHMARNYGVKVKAYNISHEQIVYAARRAHDEGLDDRVEFIEDDYRNANHRADAFVSVGMLEHVGPEHYATLGAVIDRCLKDEGLGLIHSIGRNRVQPLDPWISERIFPGAYPPTLREMADVFEPYDLSVLDVENLRLHYAQTCRDWLSRFNAAQERIEKMFDPNFVRAWRLYLAGSMAGFTSGSLQLFQVVFAHQTNNHVPLTREHLYLLDGVERDAAEYHAQV